MTDASPSSSADDHATVAKNVGAHILSDKVNRALEVRTDTVAMKAALEALAQLPDSSVSAGGGDRHATSGVVDSRSVRVAIEQDALRQALLMQDELRTLVGTVSRLRESVSDAAAIASKVAEAIDANVASPAKSSREGKEEEADNVENGASTIPEGALEHERQLAARLFDAFRERDEAAQRTEAVCAFLEKFDLSEQDSQMLEHYAFEDMEEDRSSTTNAMHFLDALERVRRIRLQLGKSFGTSTSVLMNERESTMSTVGTGAQKMGATSAIRMMESLASKQERAYERLYHWLQMHLNLNSVAHVPISSIQDQPRLSHPPPVDEDAMDEGLAHPFVRRSLHVLRHVPAFYSHTIELIATLRRAEETRRFLLALTSGYNGMPPIEMKAHDPVNYVGDMLAFIFRSFSMEAEIARGLVKYKAEEEFSEETIEENHEDDEDDEDGNEDTFDKPMSSLDVLRHAMSGVSRPLKSRIQQVVISLARRPDEDDEGGDEDVHGTTMDGIDEEGAVARMRVSSLYSICGLLLFYHAALNRVANKFDTSGDSSKEESSLIAAVMECLEGASEAYVASTRVYGAMLESLAMLSGEHETSLAHSMMTEITEARQTSPGFSMDLTCPPNVEASLSLDFACETLVSSALSFCRSLDDAVTLKVSVTAAKKSGLAASRVAYFNNLIAEKENTMVDELVEAETTEVLDICGLGSLITAWVRMQQVYVDGMTMATHPGLSPEEVETAMKEFYSSLYSPPIPALENVKDPVLRKRARSKTAEKVAETYSELYGALTSDKGGYDDLSFMGHTPSQVRTLFSA